MEEQVKQGAPIATHKGVLAGLSEEERAQLISITDVMVDNALKYIGGNIGSNV